MTATAVAAAPVAPATPDRATGADFLHCVETDLARVEDRLKAETRSDIGAVREISGHTLLSGGKRLRPALGILSARVVNRDFPENRAYAGAAAAELIHMATLMHDDVVDAAAERRGRPTASSVFGNGITVLTGDFLFAKSIWLLAHDDENLAVVRVFADVVVGMAEGEVLQAAVARNLDTTLETYEEVIERKTARFLAGCCETGAMIGGGDDAEIAALRAYGHHLGMAFQIADDLLDFLGDPEKTGKPLGTDLRDGRVTLPLIETLRAADAPTRERLSRLLNADALTDADVQTVTRVIADHDGFSAARRLADARADRAVAELARFPTSDYRSALESLARYVVARDR
jgi:octaprenyl-diphosphate synthase